MRIKFASIAFILLAFTASKALAGPDLFLGDSAIYSADISSVKPNVLFFIDNSNVMDQTGQGKVYDPTKDYTYTGALYNKDDVYILTTQGGSAKYNDAGLTIGPAYAQHSTVTCAEALYDLQHYGTSISKLKNKGTGACNATQTNNFYTGNLLNFINYPPVTWQANHAYSVGDVVTPPSGTTEYICVIAGTSGASEPTWPTGTATATDGTVVWELRNSDTILKIVQDTVKQVLDVARNFVNAGLIVFGGNNSGGAIVQPVQDISSSSGAANYTNLTNSITNLTTLNSNHEPVNEALWDAGVYYRGQNSDSNLKIASETTSYPSPIGYPCQYNYVIVLTPGNADDNVQTKANNRLPTDLTGDGNIGLVDDAAAYLYNTDASSTLSDVQHIYTNVIQLITTEIPRLRTATEFGYGSYYNVFNSNELAKALLETMSNIVLQVNSSFVAPVVPVSPENRTYSGSRVYMGFFKPISQSYWHGNLKKYGLSSQNALTDKDGNLATWSDSNGDRIDDVSLITLPTTAVNGSFRDSARSFWLSDLDANDKGDVEAGGAGKVLKDRNFSTSPRTICTNTGSTLPTTLTDAANAFTTANSAVTDALLKVDASARDNLINFVHGIDAYDENRNSSTTDKRDWIYGDILHSRPLIVNYKTYNFTPAYERDCNVNGSYVFVGGNDGMLHAIKDCDGSEAWAFIPKDMLENLSYMTGSAHAYFVDSTPSVYIYDANNNGNLVSTDGDKVILVFGERRGGGKDAAPTSGAYYALDVSNPAAPSLMWKIDNQTAGFGELAETWSEPKIVKMRIASTNKIVAFVGGGYDNIHEDTRYGNTQTFSNTTSVDLNDTGYGDVVSTGSTAATGLTNPRGRGIYAIELATLNSSGVPDFTNSGTKIWGYTYADDSLLRYSVPSEITAIDFNHDGYADRLYVGDTGGQIWRFNVGDNTATNWTARRIFNLSSGQGRKFFYKPSVVAEPSYTMLFIGSGDREHPVNWDSNLVDRFYALKDLGQNTSENRSESDLTDVTDDLLQTTADNTQIPGLLQALNSSYGWYIRMGHQGEKVLAAPTVFNKVAYFTTYTPSITVIDPCTPVLGLSRLYAVDYKTGEAVLNYNLNNDTNGSTNARATANSGQVLEASDRVKTIGTGIPSGLVMLISPGGDLKALIGVGGVIAGENPKKGGSIQPLYWRRK